MRNRKIISFLLIIFLLTVLCVGCGSSNKPKTEGADTAQKATDTTPDTQDAGGGEHSDWIKMDLTYATMLPEDHPSTEQLNMFIEKCNERMNGLVSITIYPTSSMINQTEMYNGIKNNVCDMGFLVTSNAVGILDMCMLCDMPGFYYESGTSSAMAMYDYYNWVKDNTDEFEYVIPLTVLGLAPQAFQTNKPLKTMDDLKGMNFYTPASYVEGLSRWGVTGSTMDYSEIYEAARNGLIDGMVMTVGAAANMMAQEVTDYCYVTNLIGQANAIIINRSVFERMPESQQKLFLELWGEVQREYVNKYLEDFNYGPDVMSQKYCKEVGTLEKLPDEMQKQMLEAVKDIPDKYAKQLDDKGLPGTEALAYYREVLEKYNKEFPGSMDGYLVWRD